MSGIGGDQGAVEDGPARLLSWTAALLSAQGAHRAEWAKAMTGELARIESHSQRWRFALGCARATLVIGGRGRGEGRALVLGVAAAAVACAAVVGYGLDRYPGIVSGPGTWLALATFLAVLVGYVAVALVARSALARTGGMSLGVVGGMVAAAGWLLVGLSPLVLSSPAVASIALLVPLLLAAGVGSVGERRCRRQGRFAAAGPVVCSAVVAGLTVFLVWVADTIVTAGRPYDAGLMRDFRSSGATDLATFAVNDSLGSGMVLLVLVPLTTVVMGSVGVVLTRIPRHR